MRFISEIATSSTARIIVESAIKLAKRLNLPTVAEGIETEGQLEILKDLGCDRGASMALRPRYGIPLGDGLD